MLGGNARTGLSNSPTSNFLIETRVFSSAASLSAGAHFGASLSAGDFDGDGITDLVVGAPDRTVGGVTGAGHAVVFTFPFQYGAPFFEWTFAKIGFSAGTNDHFGQALATGTFEGSSLPDLAIGVPGRAVSGQSNAGEVVVLNNFAVLSDSHPLGKEYQVWNEISTGSDAAANDHFGAALATGDFNGDGPQDLAVGVPRRAVVVTRNGSPVTLTNAGEVHVIYGSSGGLSYYNVRAPQRWNQDTAFGAPTAAAGNQFGAPLTAWNFGRNELSGVFPLFILRKTADLAIGAPFQTVNSVSGAGEVGVMYGSFLNKGLTGSGNVIFSADGLHFGGLTSAHFGAGVY